VGRGPCPVGQRTRRPPHHRLWGRSKGLCIGQVAHFSGGRIGHLTDAKRT
jgi:hypothetical protein